MFWAPLVRRGLPSRCLDATLSSVSNGPTVPQSWELSHNVEHEKYTKNVSNLNKSGSFGASGGCWAPSLSAGGDSDTICSETLVLLGGLFDTLFDFFAQFSMYV